MQGLQIGGTRNDTLLQCGGELAVPFIRNILASWGCRKRLFQALGGTAFGPVVDPSADNQTHGG
jgi:hypothetical protein